MHGEQPLAEECQDQGAAAEYEDAQQQGLLQQVARVMISQTLDSRSRPDISHDKLCQAADAGRFVGNNADSRDQLRHLCKQTPLSFAA